MEATIYNDKGKKAGTFNAPESIFGLPWNADLVHQVVVSMRSNARKNVAHTKDRGEVRGGGKKPWRQKGTGRARHGSTRSPIWVGGGVTHGPRNEKVYDRKINQKMRQKALLVALSRKYHDGEVIFVDSIGMTEPKARAGKEILAALQGAGFEGLGKKRNAALIALPRQNRAAAKSFSNFGNVETAQIVDLNPVTVLSSKYLIIAEPEAAVEVLSKKKVLKSSK
jgi:large subunit ribosomal protein L4